MLYSRLFGKTTKNIISDADSVNAKLLSQAGFISKQLSGVYNYLPLGLRVLKKIQQIIREEMDAVGGQEILMPALTQLESWQTTKRQDLPILFHLKGQEDNDLVLNPTHEEVVTPLAKNFIFSYRDLPSAVYQIQDKFRNEPRAKSGLLRGREFNMKDLYSFHSDQADLDRYYELVKQAYFKIFNRLGLEKQTVLTFASGGSFSKYSHEFQTVCPHGEDTIYLCQKCHIAVNKEIISEQDTCPECGAADLRETKAIEVGNIFKLGTKFSSAFNFSYQDNQGNPQPVFMGCYGLGPSRTMGAIVEVFHDEHGIVWPSSVAPYHVHLVALDLFDAKVKSQADSLYQQLLSSHLEVLYDDRTELTAGAKFTDADLIGIPVRLLISQRSLESGGVEIKRRSSQKSEIISLNQISTKIFEN